MSVQHISDRIADTGAAVSAGCVAIGFSIGEVNQYLQAAAFIVAVISGSCAAYYYIRKARQR